MELSKQQKDILAQFGANLRRLRVKAELTQAKFAELTDVELRTEQKWERGQINPPLTTVMRIQAVLKCGWEELMGKAAK
jgi:transcriptional regulator with XRE-family HTH domain